jgi:hypothetical protein
MQLSNRFAERFAPCVRSCGQSVQRQKAWSLCLFTFFSFSWAHAACLACGVCEKWWGLEVSHEPHGGEVGCVLKIFLPDIPL